MLRYKDNIHRYNMSTIYNKGFRSVYKLNAHVVFVVKYRRKAINQDILNRLQMIFAETLNKWECTLLEFSGESDHVHLLIDYKPDIALSTLIGNLKTVSSRKVRKENPNLAQKYFYGKPYFWTGAYFVVTFGGVTVEQLRRYVENQSSPNE